MDMPVVGLPTISGHADVDMPVVGESCTSKAKTCNEGEEENEVGV